MADKGQRPWPKEIPFGVMLVINGGVDWKDKPRTISATDMATDLSAYIQNMESIRGLDPTQVLGKIQDYCVEKAEDDIRWKVVFPAAITSAIQSLTQGCVSQ